MTEKLQTTSDQLAVLLEELQDTISKLNELKEDLLDHHDDLVYEINQINENDEEG